MAARKHRWTKIDSFVNWVTGIGTRSRDKRASSMVAVHELDWATCEDLHRGNDLAATIAEKLPEEMLRKGFSILIEGDREQTEALDAYLEDLGTRRHLKEALIWDRVFGGAAILIGADDGAVSLSEPLNENKIRSIKYLTVLDRTELSALSYYDDPLAENYGRPELYQLHPTTGIRTTAAANLTVHESRLIAFTGVPVTRRRRIALLGWGESVYQRVYEVLRDFNLTWSGVANLLSDWQQGVFKLEGLNEIIASGDTAALSARLAVLDMQRSVGRSLALDAGGGDRVGEDFKREGSSLAGLPETLQQFVLRLAAAARMPASLLMGQSPAGLNATGDADREFFAEQVAAKQIDVLLEPVKRLARLAFLTKDGPTRGAEPENWSVKFHPLRQLSEAEEADRRLKIAQADQVYLAAQVVLPEEVAVTRFGGDDYNDGPIVLDNEARTALAAAKPEPAPAPPPTSSDVPAPPPPAPKPAPAPLNLKE